MKVLLRVLEEIRDPFLEVRVVTDVDDASAERGEEVVEGFSAGEVLDEDADGAKAFDEVSLGRRVIDEGLERRILCGGIGGVGGGVACDVDPFLDEVEYGVE